MKNLNDEKFGDNHQVEITKSVLAFEREKNNAKNIKIMKTIKCAQYFLLLVLLLGFVSCEDQESVENAIIGRSWTGNIGLYAENGEPLFSTYKFEYSGFGQEMQYYQSDGAYYDSFQFQWYWDNDYENNLVLDYGRLGVSFMDNVYISGRYMKGIFYFKEGDRGFNFSLEME